MAFDFGLVLTTLSMAVKLAEDTVEIEPQREGTHNFGGSLVKVRTFHGPPLDVQHLVRVQSFAAFDPVLVAMGWHFVVEPEPHDFSECVSLAQRCTMRGALKLLPPFVYLFSCLSTVFKDSKVLNSPSLPQ